ncbi:hypothetical protein [Nocardiopsis ansamitocini]|uniref:hypothetical protein n=1 Tax=Nocardiopsis ansamitocini TaxID=1670832 RepID=UPI0025525C67|nr:hypothetical protein [Nocardiopsis ansamitocini]
MAVVGSGIRIASGGGLHASIVLMTPFSISSSVPSGRAFITLFSMYIVLLVITTLPGMLAFRIENRSSTDASAPSLKAAKRTSSAIVGLSYFILPATLMITEGFQFEIASFSVFFFLLGFSLHRAFLAITFSKYMWSIFSPIALLLPVALILVRVQI